MRRISRIVGMRGEVRCEMRCEMRMCFALPFRVL